MKQLEGVNYLEQVEYNKEIFSCFDRGSWGEPKEERFKEAIENFDAAFKTIMYIHSKIFASDGLSTGPVGTHYSIGKDNKWIIGVQSTVDGVETEQSRLIRENLQNSYCIIDKNDKSNNKFILGTFRDDDGNTYTLTYGAKEANWLKIDNTDNPDPTYTNYSLSRMYTKLTGMPDQEIPSSDPYYNVYRDSYGQTIKLYSNKVEFSGTLTAPLNSIAAYTKSGDNITFTNSTVSSLYSATLIGNKFNLIISLSADMVVVIEYTATT